MASFPFSVGGDVDVGSSSSSNTSNGGGHGDGSSDRDDGGSIVDISGNILSGASSSRRRSGSPSEVVAIVDDATTALLYTAGFEEAFGGEGSAPWLPVWYGATDVQGAYDNASDMLSDADSAVSFDQQQLKDDDLDDAPGDWRSYHSTGSSNVSGGESESEDPNYGNHRDDFVETQHHVVGVAANSWLTAIWPDSIGTPPPAAPQWATAIVSEPAAFPSDPSLQADDTPTSLGALLLPDAWPASLDEHVASFKFELASNLTKRDRQQQPHAHETRSWTAPTSPSSATVTSSTAASPGPTPAFASASASASISTAASALSGAAPLSTCQVCSAPSVYCRQMCRRCYDHQPRMLQLKQARQQRYNKSEKGLARVRRSKARNKQRRAASGSGSSSSSSTDDDAN